MRQRLKLLLLFLCLASSVEALAASGKIVKVLPEFLDSKGRTSLSPSLYERDAYQAMLRSRPERRSGLRFYIEWKTKGAVWEPLTIRLELRGAKIGGPPPELIVDKKLVNKGRRLTQWAELTLTKEEYNRLGAVTSWRASLWEGTKLLGQQQSFLW